MIPLAWPDAHSTAATVRFAGRRHRLGQWVGRCMATLLLITLAAAASSGGEVDFQRDIEPLLQQHCVDCHGPDAAEADLRLDSMLAALRGGDSGEAAVVPGASDRSYLISRILHTEETQRMPPDSPPLADEQIALLKAWIDDAPSWAAAQAELAEQTHDHWAFQPLTRPLPPASDAHRIDAFITAKLAAAGLQRSSQADRRKLIRRLYLVMHGLPPTPEQVDAFLDDSRPNAWELLVEQVLASERYGQRWATHWLDLVRFGETHGFETNRVRPNAWHYRDWVIEAFNADKPYDQFIMEQIAGDAVGADVGTGFLVAGPYDLVKSKDTQLQQMQRQDELADMINTTGTAFLGLSLGCARCHNHKFDPISQTDYYAVQAVFAGVQHSDRALPPDEHTERQLATIDKQIADLQRQLARFTLKPSSVKGTPGDRSAGGTADEPFPKREGVNARLNIETLQGVDVRFVRLTIDATNHGEPCIDELEIYAGDENVALASAGAKASSSGDFVHPLHKLEHINDGRHGNNHSWIALQASGGWVQIELAELRRIDSIRWGRDRSGNFQDRLAIDYRFEGSLDGETWSVLASAADRLPFDPKQQAGPVYHFDAFPSEQARAGRALLDRLDSLRAKRGTLSDSTMVYAGTFHQPGPTHRLYRGEPSAPREEVAPAAIKSLSGMSLPADSPEQQRRLAFAHWIADADNPLTARVIANRLWQFHFGTGIVDTPSDFGGNGTPPSHPELLDWLAAELVQSGWSLKHLHRVILTSQTWRQDSRPHREAMASDAASRLLWRFPPRRLEAEGIRDSMLAVTGKLDTRLGGPGFSGFEVEPENVYHYFPKTRFGPEDWRRMIYMTKVRQERDAVFGVFDCPDYNQVVPKRTRSTTPLQALNLFNSRFVLQQADFLVQRLEREAASPSQMITQAYELVFNRRPEPDEVEAALAFIDQTDWHQFARVLLNANEFVLIP